MINSLRCHLKNKINHSNISQLFHIQWLCSKCVHITTERWSGKVENLPMQSFWMTPIIYLIHNFTATFTLSKAIQLEGQLWSSHRPVLAPGLLVRQPWFSACSTTMETLNKMKGKAFLARLLVVVAWELWLLSLVKAGAWKYLQSKLCCSLKVFLCLLFTLINVHKLLLPLCSFWTDASLHFHCKFGFKFDLKCQ